VAERAPCRLSAIEHLVRTAGGPVVHVRPLPTSPATLQLFLPAARKNQGLAAAGGAAFALLIHLWARACDV